VKALNAFIGMNYSNVQALEETVTATWDFGVSNGRIEVESSTKRDGYAPITLYTRMEYGSDQYLVQLLLAKGDYQTLGEACTLFGSGTYGGNWNDW
jgi:hypothetical protein